MENRLSWFDWQRYSNRQERKMLMGGVVGSIVYEGRLGEFLPLLDICSKVHVGKNTSFGLGKMKCQESDAEQVVRYIGRYTHRVAISNSRIIEVRDGQVQFWYKDYKAGNIWKTMWLTAPEFIRRFLYHVLPAGFHKIRHYGFLANGRCKIYVARIRAMLSSEHANDACSKTQATQVDGMPCPQCGNGLLIPLTIKTRFATIIT